MIGLLGMLLPFLKTLTLGSFLGVGFYAPFLWWLSLPGIIWWITYITETSTRQQAGWRGLGTFLVLNIWAYSWFTSVSPIAWLTIDSHLALMVLHVYWLLTALCFAIPGFFLAVGIRMLHQTGQTWMVIPGVSVGWLLADVVGSVIFSVFSIGPGSAVNTHMSFGYIGYHLAQHLTLFHISAWGGVYSLTVVLVALMGLIWWSGSFWYRARWSAVVVGVVSLMFVLGAIPASAGLFTPSKTVGAYSVLVLETNFYGQQHDDFVAANQRIDLYKDIFQTLDISMFDHVILPEDARFMASFGTNLFGLAQLRQIFGTSTEALLVDSSRVTVDDNAILRGEIIQLSDFSQIQAFDKQFLVPHGEFLPTLAAVSLRALGLGSIVAELEATLDYRPGPSREQALVAVTTPRILFCFESVNPRGVRKIIDTKVIERPLVVHPLSHAWFDNPSILQSQLDTMLRVQARWNRVFIVSAGNKAPSAVYLPDGSMLQSSTKTPLHSNSHIDAYQFVF